jgi:hypothetical protein
MPRLVEGVNITCEHSRYTVLSSPQQKRRSHSQAMSSNLGRRIEASTSQGSRHNIRCRKASARQPRSTYWHVHMPMQPSDTCKYWVCKWYLSQCKTAWLDSSCRSCKTPLALPLVPPFPGPPPQMSPLPPRLFPVHPPLESLLHHKNFSLHPRQGSPALPVTTPQCCDR